MGLEQNAVTPAAFASTSMSDLRETLMSALGQKQTDAEQELLPEKNADFKDKHILLVEDNELNREIAQEILREYGFRVEGAHQGPPQVGHEHGLGAEGGHTGSLCLHLNLGPVIGRQDDDGRIVVQAADLAGDLDAVHIRQPPVNEIGVVDIAHLDGLPRAQHRLLARSRRTRHRSFCPKKMPTSRAGRSCWWRTTS